MSTISKRTEGTIDEAAGKIKAGIGKAIGNEQMQVEGRAKQAKGVAEKEGAKAVERGKGAVEKVVGKAKAAVGNLTDDEDLKEEGEDDETVGEARRELNR